MKYKRLLIADSSDVIAEDLTQRLADRFQIAHCTDGFAAQRLLQSFQPDVVVLDLMLRGLDGIALMDWINQTDTPPKILVTTFFMTPFVERMLRCIPFDYMMQKPCDCGVLADRVWEIASDPGRDIIMSPRARSSATGMLHALQICVSHKGYQYLQYGVELYRDEPEASMTRTVYPAIGKRFQVTPEAVERDIRRAINTAWENCDAYIWRMYFDCGPNGTVPRPTNTVFISTLARRLNMEQEKRA